MAKKGKRSEWLLGKKIRGKLLKASKLSNTDLKENTQPGGKWISRFGRPT